MKKRVADIIVDCLEESGITDCFSVVGGGAMHLNNAFVLNDKINKIYCHHEQACAMAAEGYARACGKIAAVCVTSGPGGTNAINGIQGAWADSIPVLVISGYPRYETSVPYTGLDLRCRGVQENDIIHMVKKITKYAKQITEPKEIVREVKKAIAIAMHGRRGPVWLDIPLNVQGALAETDELYPAEELDFLRELDEACLENCIELMKKAERPCILTGSGIRTSNTVELFRECVKQLQIPIVGGSLQADICCNAQPLYYGMSGNIGPRAGNFILQNADVILVLGNSLSFKQTGFNQELFAPKAKIIMVDADEAEARKPGLHVELPVHSDLKDFFVQLEKRKLFIKAPEAWIAYCEKVRGYFPKYEALLQIGEIQDTERVPALLFWKKFLEKMPENAVIALGNSSCVHGVLQEGINSREQRVLVNYNCGSMGDDLPEAVGAAVALNREIYCITGDGSIMMNLQELQTIRYYGFPIKIIVFENDGYGAIRNTCSNFFHGLYTGCDAKSGISFPDFGKVAKAFELDYYKCSSVEKLDGALQWLWEQKGACMLEISQRINEIKGPKLESRMSAEGVFITPALHDMSPLLSEEELKRLMF